MRKKLSLFIAVFFITSMMFAQWTNVGGTWAFAPEGIDTIRGSVQGMACDPDGNLWVLMYGSSTVVNADKDTLTGIIAIYVYKPDGTQTDFSPIWNIATGGGFVVDTLNSGTVGTGRGLRADNDGNMLAMYSGGNGGIMYRINYKTGEGMNKVELEVGSPLSPGVDANGNIYVGFVVPQNPIKVFDKDFKYVENAIDATIDFARTMLVSKDGMTIYHFSYPSTACYVYTKADEFSAFELADSIKGAKSESATWDPSNPDVMWIGGGSDNDVPDAPFNKENHYAYNVKTNEIVDSLVWVSNGNGERPRGIAITDNAIEGKRVAYTGVFSGGSSPCFQKFVTDITSGVEEVEGTVPSEYALGQNYPNPFNPTTNIRFSIPEAGLVTIKVYDILGQEVATLLNDIRDANTYNVSFDASKLTSGMYVYTISAGNFVSSKKDDANQVIIEIVAELKKFGHFFLFFPNKSY